MDRTTLLVAVVACLAAGAAAQLPAGFANAGAPAFLNVGPGLVLDQEAGTTLYAAMYSGGARTLISAPAGALSTSTGAYKSWECTPDAGNATYRAIVEVVDTAADGTKSAPKLVCEAGLVDLAMSSISWAQSDGACPTTDALTLSTTFDGLNQALVDGLRAALACGEPASTEFEAGEPAAVMSSEQTGSSAPSDFLEAASGTTTDAEGLDAPIAGSETAGAVDAGAVDAAALAEPIAGSEPVTDGTPAEFADAASVAAAAIEGSGAGVDASQPIAGSEAAPVRRRRLLLL